MFSLNTYPSALFNGWRARTAAAIALALLVPRLHAQPAAQPASEPDLIRAVRAGDPLRWRALLKGGADVAAMDAKCDTALHVAAYRGDAQAVEALLERGAKPDARNADGVTPLLYGAGSDEVVKELLAFGANPNAASKLGFTPLMAAAAHPESHGTVARLLNAGADVHVKLKGQEIMALKAVYGGDPVTLAMLLDRGASPQQTKGDEPSPLATAAYFGDRATAELLLKHGADLNYDSDFAGHALNWALYSGHTELAAELIEKGSDLHFKSPWGHQTPPAVFSGYSEQGDPAIARLLVARGADVNEANEQGATALTLALKEGPHSELVAFLEKSGARLPSEDPKQKTSAARRMPDGVGVRERVQRSVDLLQRASTGFVENRFVRDEAKCVSCHHQYLPAVAFAWGSKRGLHVDGEALGHQLSAQIAMWHPREEAARQMEDPLPDSPVQVGYGLMALQALSYAPDSMTEAYVRYLVNGQSADGSWHWTDLRPPLEGGRFTATAWAVRAIHLYPLPHSEDRMKGCLSQARHWLRTAKPVTFGDQLAQLMGLAWAGESHWRLRGLGSAILAMQARDGGWAQLKDLQSDAWATGEALFALREAATVSPADETYLRGVRFLLKTQYDDGSWWVQSRTWPFQPHFDSGFPHGNDQWISAGATAWAAMALLQTLPEDPAARPLPSVGALVASYLSAAAARDRAVALQAAAVPAVASTGPAIDFARDVYPVLERSCVKCHSGEKPRARFSITSREALLKGGQSGEPAVVPGKGVDSQLVVFASDEVEDLEMPPLKHRDKFPPLSPSEVKRIEVWIDQGAPWTPANPSATP